MTKDIVKGPLLNRRTFLQYSVLLPSSAPFFNATEALAAALPSPPAAIQPPEYIIRRERDELFLSLRAVGYRDTGSGHLVPISGAKDRFLIFTLSPQHFAEKALPVAEIPAVFDENSLLSIELLASAQSKLVFRVPHKKRLSLTLEELLAWHDLELVLPDLDRVGQPYDLEIPDSALQYLTTVEMPWGVELSPVLDPTKPAPLTFSDPSRTLVTGSWTELWTTALMDKRAEQRTAPVRMEVLSVRGFEKIGASGSVEQGNFVATYQNFTTQAFPSESTPLSDYDRMDIAASLSRRFPYTGIVGPPPIQSGLLSYPQANVCVSACFAPGRTVAATQLRLSARGGWLQLEGKWDPFPGCGLSGWVHSASLGRDNHVEVVSEGFLYPFGTPCELIVISERVFAKDERGHYVAPIIQQAFIQIPQPNSLTVGHVETPFKTISITTRRSPPLDLPATGRPATYREYDFFLPMVKGRPFAFEHVGVDWNGEEHRSAMPMFFVNNKARLANGLIWEPGYSWNSTQANSPCATPPPNGADAAFTIPQTGDGLRVVDKAWALQPGRFAQYNGSLVALANGLRTGDTTQRVSWIEWTRANIPNLNPSTIVTPPFRPRARTLRVSIQSTGQLSGEPSASVVTYRDTRFTAPHFLDPEPTTPSEEYFSNVTAQLEDPQAPYLYTLETRALVSEAGAVTPRSPNQVADDIRDTYYGVSKNPSPIPTELFTGIDNEIRFGSTSTAEGVGGLSVPDTHTSILTRKEGVLGDATFNEGRWLGYAAVKSRLQANERLDFAAFSKANRSQLDIQPFEASRTQVDRNAALATARTLMGFAAAPAIAVRAPPNAISAGLRLGDLFGADAQIIPGLRFMDIFREIALAGASDTGAPPAALGAEDHGAAPPLVWNVRLSGIEWLTALLNADPQNISFSEVISAIAQLRPQQSGSPVSMGMEATLNWSNRAFKKVDIGPVAFIPEADTKISIDAKSRIDLGLAQIPTTATDFKFSPGKPRISARAELSSFSVQIFSAIEIAFSAIAFDMSEDGHKSFTTKVASVKLLPPLDFINQLQSIFGGLGDDQAIHVDLSPAKIRIFQTLRFPASGDMPLFMGPAQITNLAFSWAVTIPLIGRDVLAVAFGISSREKPLTIYVPPWYGGKAYALLETTTRGCRLVEVSMEYGALVPIEWGIAKGQASLTAGIFYMLERDDARQSANVQLRAFIKASADLSVAGIIQFCGLIYIALTSDSGSGGDRISGVVTVSVSIKIGFVRISYSFSASHEETRRSSSRVAVVSDIDAPRMGLQLTRRDAEAPSPTRRRVRDRMSDDILPFGPTFSSSHRAAFRRVLAGYR
ncbi:hypothetical protein Q2941_44515 [Bradyrhizobium sp. UFLA05-153]